MCQKSRACRLGRDKKNIVRKGRVYFVSFSGEEQIKKKWLNLLITCCKGIKAIKLFYFNAKTIKQAGYNKKGVFKS